MLHARRLARSLAVSSGRGVSICSTRTPWTGSLLRRFRIKVGRSLAIGSSRGRDFFQSGIAPLAGSGWLNAKHIYMYLVARYLTQGGKFARCERRRAGAHHPQTLQSRSSERVRPLVPSAKWVPSEGK
jgi:hypothetical protein